jgi:opacity protein-like surface antigen
MSQSAHSLTGCRLLVAFLTLGFIGASATARAQGFISPIIGYDFGGDANCPLVSTLIDCKDTRLNVGVSLGKMGSVVGVEEEIAYAPDFFGSDPAVSSSVLTLMSNFMIAPKIGPVRPYVVAGIGLMKSHIELNTASILTTDENSFGWDLGGGVMGFFGAHFGVRGDLRYFHSFQDLTVLGFTLENSKLNFGRASAGAVFKF